MGKACISAGGKHAAGLQAMNQFPLVSVVIPSLDQAQYLEQALRSVLAQDYPHMEVLVIDGGSTDGTLDILHSYEGRVRWISEPDSGQANAVNKGWRLAQGEILGWVNADDVLEPQAAAAAVQAFQLNGPVACVYGRCQFIDSSGRKIGDYAARPYDYFDLFVGGEDYIPQPAAFVRRMHAFEAGLLNENCRYVLDYDFWLRLGMRHPFLHVPMLFASLRIHHATKTGRELDGFADELMIMAGDLLSSPYLPESINKNRDLALSNISLHAASYSFWSGRTGKALGYLKRCTQLSGLRQRRAFWLIFLFSLFGRLGWRLAEVLHGNPFRLERPFWKRSRIF